MSRSILTFHQQKIVRELVRAHRTGRHKGAFSHVEMTAAQWIQIVGARIHATRGDCEALAASSLVSLRYGPRGEPTMVLREEAYEAVRTNFGESRKASVLSAIHELALGDAANAVLASRVVELTGLALTDVISEARRLEAEGRLISAEPEEPGTPGDVLYNLVCEHAPAAPPVPPRPALPAPAALPSARVSPPVTAPASPPRVSPPLIAPAPAPRANPPTAAPVAPSRVSAPMAAPPPTAPPAPVPPPPAAAPRERTANAGMVHDVRAHFEDLAAQQVALTRSIDALLAHFAEGTDDPGELKRLVLDLWLKSRSAVEFAGGVAELAQAFKLI